MAIKEEKIKEYLKASQTVVLATTDLDGAPDLRTLGGYDVSDYFVYFSTSKTSNKVKQLANKKETAVFFQHENQSVRDFINATIYGDAVLIENDEEYENIKELIIRRKPHLKITKETHNIYKVVPRKIKVLDFSEQNINERVSQIFL